MLEAISLKRMFWLYFARWDRWLSTLRFGRSLVFPDYALRRGVVCWGVLALCNPAQTKNSHGEVVCQSALERRVFQEGCWRSRSNAL